MEKKLIIFSAPSGSGKTTIVHHLLSKFNFLGFSISACTRDKRGRSEKDGKDYYFFTPDEFKNKINKDEFVEWEEVYPGSYYGTLKAEIERVWASGKHVVFDVDVKGGIKLKKYFGDRALAIFVKAPSEEVIKQRLMSRGTETEDSLSKRLFKIRFEMTFQDQFDIILTNDKLETTFNDAEKLVLDFTRETA